MKIVLLIISLFSLGDGSLWVFDLNGLKATKNCKGDTF